MAKYRVFDTVSKVMSKLMTKLEFKLKCVLERVLEGCRQLNIINGVYDSIPKPKPADRPPYISAFFPHKCMNPSTPHTYKKDIIILYITLLYITT